MLQLVLQTTVYDLQIDECIPALISYSVHRCGGMCGAEKEYIIGNVKVTYDNGENWAEKIDYRKKEIREKILKSEK